jgi:hypothetical protein
MGVFDIKMEETISMIDKTTDLFYKNKITEGYSALEATLISINTITELVYGQTEVDFRSKIEKLNDILKEAMIALESRDMILFADIFQYELKQVLESFVM